MEILIAIVGFVLLIILLFMIVGVFKAVTRIVPQEQRLVIYRLGRFHRIAGPGPVRVFPRLEQVVRTLEVRDHPIEISLPGIMAFGLPNDLALNLWCCTDLARAAGGDKEKLAALVQLNDSERRQQIDVKTRIALVNQLVALQKQMPLPDKSTVMDKIIALAPGSPRYLALLEGVRAELERTLPSVGVILNTNQPVILTKRGLSEEIIEAIKRRRGREMDSEWLTGYVDELRRRYPDLQISQAMLAQILTSLEGLDVGKVQRLFLEHDQGVQSEVEFELDKDGERPNVIVKPRPERAETGRAASPSHSGLTKSDLAVLKRVPRNNRDQQMSA